MQLSRALRDEERTGDVAIGVAMSQEGQHLDLTRRQVAVGSTFDGQGLAAARLSEQATTTPGVLDLRGVVAGAEARKLLAGRDKQSIGRGALPRMPTRRG